VRKSEEKYRGLTENVNLGIYRNTVGPEGKFIEANPAIVGMFGYKSKEEFLAINVLELYQHADGRNKFNDKMLKEGFVRGEELWLKKKDGSPFVGSVSAVAVKDEQGHVKYYDGIIDDITERKRAEEALRASLREKEVLLREVHHRVKNNMQVISSLFNLQAGHTTNEECRGILKEGQTRIRSMSLVHEKLYQSRDLSKIDFAGYIQSLAVHLLHVYLVNPAQVRMETDFEDVSLDINSAVPCGLILNELISNALKHAFSEGRTGVIKIGLRRGPGGAVELRVADDGVGFPKGLDFRKAESFGLQIVNLLVDQLEATIEIDRTKGTAFTVTFRKLKYALRT
jgi:PAS domain S-box-containing protein